MSRKYEVDVAGNRAAVKYSPRIQIARVLWALMLPFFILSPRPWWGLRRWMLRGFGAKIGADVHIYPTVRIFMPWNLEVEDGVAIGDRATLYCLGRIKIGPRTTISQGSHLCAGSHDLSRLDRPLIKPPIQIGPDSWVAADAFVGPGVTVGAGAVVGARAVVMKDVEPGHIVVGNPARTIRKIET